MLEIIRAYLERQLVQEALQSAETIQDLTHKSFAFMGIAVPQAELGDVEGAFKTANKVTEEHGERDHTLGDIDEMQAKQGDVQGVTQTLKRINDHNQRAFASARIAQQLGKTGNLDAAIGMLDDLGGEEIARSNALASVTSYLRTPEQFDKVLLAAEMFREEAPKGFVYYRIAVNQARQGHIERQVSWANEQRSPLLKSYILLGCAEGMLHSKEHEETIIHHH